MEFNIAKPEQARWFAILVKELQDYGVNYKISKDSNIVYVHIQ